MIVVAALSLFMLEQPQIVKKLISYVICRKLVEDDELSYVEGDELLACSGDSYYHFRHTVVLPSLLFFCLLPLALFFILFIKKRQDTLDTEWTRVGMGIIYNGYTKDAYYWNLVMNTSKIGLILLTQMFIYDIRILVFLLVLWFYLYKHLISTLKPYLEEGLITAEKYSLYAYLITVFCSYFMTQNMPFIIKIFCISLIVVVNVIALGYIGKQLYEMSKKSAIKKKIQSFTRRVTSMFGRSSKSNVKSSETMLDEYPAHLDKSLMSESESESETIIISKQTAITEDQKEETSLKRSSVL